MTLLKKKDRREAAFLVPAFKRCVTQRPQQVRCRAAAGDVMNCRRL